MANIVHRNAAGIDVGSGVHYAAVSKQRSNKPIRKFGAFTADNIALAQWLKECKVDTIVMEATGVYWINLFATLEDFGFEVWLVNARHVKNVPGRKSDVQDAQWLQKLHEAGLLQPSFQPAQQTKQLREYVRLRKQIIRELSKTTQRMEKSLQMMNIKLGNTIRDVSGKTGQAIIGQILEGERDPMKLIEFVDPRIKAPKETILKSLEANWKQEHLFALKLAVQSFQFLHQQLNQCDQETEEVLQTMNTRPDTESAEVQKVRRTKNQPKFHVEKYLQEQLGVDVTQIPGISVTTALTIFSETGPDIATKFPTEKQFLSWLNVVPNNKISGDKVLSSRVHKRKNKAGQAFREAANGLWNGKNSIGEYLRNKKAKKGGGAAIVAAARKLASIYYAMVTKQTPYDHKKVRNTNQINQLLQIRKLEKRLENMKAQVAV